MFERYTEGARNTIFQARFEASSAGSAFIVPSHLLLGVLRADLPLALRLFGSPEKVESIRLRLGTPEQKPGASIDVPFSQEGKRVLAYAAEESERTNQQHIGTMHILLGLIRVGSTSAATVLREMGVSMERLREDAARKAEPVKRDEGPLSRIQLSGLLSRLRGGRLEAEFPEYGCDLSAAALQGALNPLIGREAEVERILGILLRRHGNWVALTGEPGVGKSAVLEGVAQQIFEGGVSSLVGGWRVLAIEAERFADWRDKAEGPVVVCVEGFFDLPPEEMMRAVMTLRAKSRAAEVRAIVTGTPESFKRIPARLAVLFEQVALLPPSEAETIGILTGLKEKYEHYHAVKIAEDAVLAAVTLSRRFRSRRLLPDRALDLLDDGCSWGRLHGKTEITAQEIEAAVKQ